MSQSSNPQLLIVGSGWAGFELANGLDKSKYDVTVISPRRTTAYTPLLASAACGLFNFYLAEEPVRNKSRHVRFIKANVLNVDFAAKKIHCAPAFEEDQDLTQQQFDLPYDKLFLAPGCVPNTFGTPGVTEHGVFMKNVSDAMLIRKRLFDNLEKASLPNVSEQRARDLLHIAIVGGGPTGVEMAAELYDLAHTDLKDTYPEVAQYIKISIYDVAPIILASYDQKLHEYAVKSLLTRNVNVETSTHIQKVEEDAFYTKEQGRTPYGILIWATGNKSVSLTEDLQARQSQKGLRRILTNDHLNVFQSQGSDAIYDDVFALGDAADIDGASLPTTAEVAVQKARYLVHSLNHGDHGPFKYKQKQLVSYIGSHDGVIEGKEHSDGWTGKSAWLAWRGGSIMWARGWRHRAMIALTWILNAVFGPEMARM